MLILALETLDLVVQECIFEVIILLGRGLIVIEAPPVPQVFIGRVHAPFLVLQCSLRSQRGLSNHLLNALATSSPLVLV